MLLYTSRERMDLKASIRAVYNFTGADKEAIRASLLAEQFKGVSNRDFDSCWDEVMILYGDDDDIDDYYDYDIDDDWDNDWDDDENDDEEDEEDEEDDTV